MGHLWGAARSSHTPTYSVFDLQQCRTHMKTLDHQTMIHDFFYIGRCFSFTHRKVELSKYETKLLAASLMYLLFTDAWRVYFYLQIQEIQIISGPFESAALLRDWQDSLFVTPIGGDGPLEAELRDRHDPTPRLKQSQASRFLRPVSLCEEEPSHTAVCRKRVASEQSETLRSPPTVCGSCLVPKLNWRMHCNSSCSCLSFILFIMLWSYKSYL